MNAIGLVIGKNEAEKQGIGTPDSTRIGVIASMMPNPVMSLIIGRRMAEQQAPPPAGKDTSIGTTGPDISTSIEHAANTAQQALTTANQTKAETERLAKQVEQVESRIDKLSKSGSTQK